MKMFNNLFDKVTDFNNLFAAYRAARKGKKYDSEILPFEFYAEENLLKLKEQMENEHISMAATANLSSTIPKNGGFKPRRSATGWFTTRYAISSSRFLTRILSSTVTLAVRERGHTRR